jgi:hypothetical protein
MLELKNYTIGATDGEVGQVADFFFDDQAWVIRYLVVETGSWLMSRKVLISPYSLQGADWEHKRLPVRITRAQVKDSPDIDTEQPVSRQHEMAYADYYRYPYYWGGVGFWGDGMVVPAPERSETAEAYARAERARHQHDDPHLRSCKAVTGYHIQASDGDIGHVQSMLVDEESWAIRYLVVETSNWWMGHQVLIPPEWITAVSWADSTVSINLSRETIKNSPRYETSAELNRQQETALYRHYGRPNYWEREHAREVIEEGALS